MITRPSIAPHGLAVFAAALLACKGADMVAIPGGIFTPETRKTPVTVTPFLLDVTEVTAEAYAACVLARGCTYDAVTCDGATYGVAGKEKHPINCVDWFEADAYCTWKGKRLPTDEEWEWAARGESLGRTYPWGSDEPGAQLCWNTDGTCAVGSHPTGDAPGGIHDLAGNVWEWTVSSVAGDARVYRGGSWGNKEARYVRAASWSRNTGTVEYGNVGFRCAK